jgi:hypothetical protein
MTRPLPVAATDVTQGGGGGGAEPLPPMPSQPVGEVYIHQDDLLVCKT